MATPFESFVQTELPLRPVMLTAENCGYSGDPNDLGAPDMVKNSPKGTFYLQGVGNKLWKKNGGGHSTWEEVGGGGGGGGVTVYASESDLMLAAPTDGTIGYATDTKHYFQRAGSRWLPYGGNGALTYANEAALLADAPELVSIWTPWQSDLPSLTPPAGTICVALGDVPSVSEYSEYNLLSWPGPDGTIGVAFNTLSGAFSDATEAAVLASTPTEKTLGVGYDTQNFWLRGVSSWAPYTGAAIYYLLNSDLLADTPADGTVGYAEDTDSFYYRYNGAWSTYILLPAYWQRVSSAWVPYAGTGLFYDTETELLADSPADGTVGFAFDAEMFYFRRSSAWRLSSADPTFWLRGASSWAAYTGSRAFYDTEIALLAATPADGTVGFALDALSFRYRRRATWFLNRNDSCLGVAEDVGTPWLSVGTTWKNILRTLRETSGPTDLTVASVADGQYLARSGATIAGVAPPASSVLTYSTEAALLAATPADGVLGYATNTKNWWWRKNSQWRAAETSTGPNQICIGPGAANAALYSTIIGAGASAGASADYSVVVGWGSSTQSGAGSSVVVGRQSVVSGIGGVAVGSSSDAESDGVAVGRDASANVNSTIVGAGAYSRATGATAIGREAVASSTNLVAPNSIAIGRMAVTNADSAIAIGYSSRASSSASAAPFSIAVGVGASTNADSAVAVGYYATATRERATALGAWASAPTLYSVVVGAGANVIYNASYESAGAVAVGYYASVDLNSSGSVVVGTYASTWASGGVVDTTDSIVIGHTALSKHARAGAIGHDSVTTATDRITLGKVGGLATQIKALQISGGLGMAGVVPTAQRAHVANPTGGAVVDAEARSAINSILSSLEALGLHALA